MPVRHDVAVEAQRLLELAERLRVLAAPGTVDLVVAAHHGTHTRLDRTKEGRVIKLEPSTLIGILADRPSVGLLAVQDPMLCVCDDLLRLDARNRSLGQDVTQVGVLPREVLKIATVARNACKAKARTKLHVRTLQIELLAHALPPLAHRRLVPRSGHAEAGGEGGGRPGVRIDAEALRPVVHGDRRDVEPRDARHVADVGTSGARRAAPSRLLGRPVQHVELLVEGHVADQRSRPLLGRERPVRPRPRHQRMRSQCCPTNQRRRPQYHPRGCSGPMRGVAMGNRLGP
mmetsp:Transcript_1621/g.5102  ORF Transcript_1621/g.5102 Transcript_1621/m.5102 type:complete len:288 (-) Transcript_1621:22-885(-)